MMAPMMTHSLSSLSSLSNSDVKVNSNISTESISDYKKHPAIIAIEGRWDRPARSNRFERAIYNLSVAFTLVTVGLAVNLIQLLISPLSLFNPPLSHYLNSFATGLAWTFTQYWIEGYDSVRITFSGLKKSEFTSQAKDEGSKQATSSSNRSLALPMEESAFVIANHVFFGDFFLIHGLANRRNMMRYCRYFLKDSIKYIPIFGWGMYLCNMPFLKRNWQRDSERIRTSLRAFVRHRLPVWLISHVEGSRMSPLKLAKSHKYAQEHGLPLLQNVLLPRCKGFTSTIQALRGSYIRHIYDVTLAYYHDRRGWGAAPSLWEILTGKLDAYQMHAHIERIPIEDVPEDEKGASQWLYATYERKDRLLAHIKEAFESKIKL